MISVLLLACSGGNPATTLDGLTVLAMAPEQVEAASGSLANVTVDVANPLEQNVRLALWACPFSACDEGGEIWVGEPFAGHQVALPVSVLVPVAPEATPLTLWGLAIENEHADLLDEFQADSDLRADPGSTLEALPLASYALARRTWTVGMGATAPAAVALNRVPEAAQVDAEVSVLATVTGTLGDEATAWPYTTLGAFAEVSVDVESGQVDVTFVAPPEPGVGRAWIVVEDGNGGTATVSWEVEVVRR